MSTPIPRVAAEMGESTPLPLTVAEPILGRSHSSGPGRTQSDCTELLDTIPCQIGPQGVRDFLDRVVASRLIPLEELERFLHMQGVLDDAELSRLTTALVEEGLLTPYQVERIQNGRTFGLLLGNYRVVDRLGAGGMGVVYKAEHLYLKRTAAIKVLRIDEETDRACAQRFGSEMQAMAVLQHPHIVAAYDAGELTIPGSRSSVLRYLAMEYAPGPTLEQVVQEQGQLPVARACNLICQAAQGLQHAHEQGLVHRDVKPSNLVLTAHERLKILDFGLVLLNRRRHTMAHTFLGTLDYIAPEQARDARSVDIRADVYGLGGTLYWLLTGQKPYPETRSLLQALIARQREMPQPLRQLRPDLPAELESLIERMLAHDPEQRPATPLVVVSALSAFAQSAIPREAARPGTIAEPVVGGPVWRTRSRRALLVSPDPETRQRLREALAALGISATDADSLATAESQLGRAGFDLILLDARLPDHGSLKLCHRLRTDSSQPRHKVLLLTPSLDAEQVAAARRVGADDLLAWPATHMELGQRVRAQLHGLEAESLAHALSDQVRALTRELEQSVKRREDDLAQVQDVLIYALSRMVELRRLETERHLRRLQGYVRVLGEEACRLPPFADQIDAHFLRALESCVPLHDIGKVALPDHIFLKPGKLDAEERAIMESHTILGAELLLALGRRHGSPLAFVRTAANLARHHHERYDGSGYPDHLCGEAIPLAARITTVADVYDALRSRLVYKPGLSHAAALRLILENSPGQFDPTLLVAFRKCETSFEQIFTQLAD